jgi:hypothetical protein
MGTTFLTAVFLVGFAWKMVVSATAFAVLSYAMARIWWKPETKLPRGIGWGVWFAVLAYHLFPVAFVKAFSLGGTYAAGNGIRIHAPHHWAGLSRAFPRRSSRRDGCCLNGRGHQQDGGILVRRRAAGRCG